MFSIVLIVHLVISVFLVILVLLQHGKGAEAGANFGGGGSSSQTVFGGGGASSFMLQLTSVIAALFFVTSLTLAYLGAQQARGFQSVVVQQPTTTEIIVPERVGVPIIPE